MELNSPDLAGLETSLELLDLSGNNITSLSSPIFQEYDFLRTLIFRENKIQTFSPGKMKDDDVTSIREFPGSDLLILLQRFKKTCLSKYD